jgi:hypothetical protein
MFRVKQYDSPTTVFPKTAPVLQHEEQLVQSTILIMANGKREITVFSESFIQMLQEVRAVQCHRSL